jgi:hypothetical protein
MKTFRSPDGTVWGVSITNAGASNAVVTFRHPNGGSTRMDRYNWFISKGPEAKSVTGRVDLKKIAESLTEKDLDLLFRRSMSVSRDPSRPVNEIPVPAPAGKPAK